MGIQITLTILHLETVVLIVEPFQISRAVEAVQVIVARGKPGRQARPFKRIGKQIPMAAAVRIFIAHETLNHLGIAVVGDLQLASVEHGHIVSCFNINLRSFQNTARLHHNITVSAKFDIISECCTRTASTRITHIGYAINHHIFV